MYIVLLPLQRLVSKYMKCALYVLYNNLSFTVNTCEMGISEASDKVIKNVMN